MNGQATTPHQKPERGGWARGTVWVAGLVVSLGAGVATAHGLYQVALASGTPRGLAWLYPLITDGLALVAYAATACRTDRGRRYAWTVVVLAAGLSGLTQASYLAGGVATAPPALRFGIGAWPAIAAAIVAHLLFLLGTDTHPHTQQQPDDPPARSVVPASAPPAAPVIAQPVAPSNGARPTAQSNAHAGVQSAAPPVPVAVQPVPDVQPIGPPAVPARPAAAKAAPSPPPGTARGRALTAARRHSTRHGELPTVDALADLAEVSRGTAAAVRKHLRTPPQTLRVADTNLTTEGQP